jgi:hypothetical protein
MEDSHYYFRDPQTSRFVLYDPRFHNLYDDPGIQRVVVEEEGDMKEVELRSDEDADMWLQKFTLVEQLYDNFGVVSVFLYNDKEN